VSIQYHSILGLPGSGKTTYLAALWHVIDAGEVATSLVLDKLIGDNAHLNKIVDAWRRCDEVPHTSMQDEKKVTIYAHAPASGQKIVLCFPDLSGESFTQQFAARRCAPDYVEGFNGSGGILLFVNANRPSDGMTLADIGPAIADADEPAEPKGEDEPAEPKGEKEWTADFVPEQVRLVDLLQFLLRPPFLRRPRRLAVVISAWDVVLAPKPAPEQWLARELPFLHQFLTNNPENFSVRVYGISAQGGDVTSDQRAALLRRTPSHRIECVDSGGDPHDLTAPVLWLTKED
jgi:hypothetical protein